MSIVWFVICVLTRWFDFKSQSVPKHVRLKISTRDLLVLEFECGLVLRCAVLEVVFALKYNIIDIAFEALGHIDSQKI